MYDLSTLYNRVSWILLCIRRCKRAEDHSLARLRLCIVQRFLYGQHQMCGANEQFYEVSVGALMAPNCLFAT